MEEGGLEGRGNDEDVYFRTQAVLRGVPLVPLSSSPFARIALRRLRCCSAPICCRPGPRQRSVRCPPRSASLHHDAHRHPIRTDAHGPLGVVATCPTNGVGKLGPHKREQVAVGQLANTTNVFLPRPTNDRQLALRALQIRAVVRIRHHVVIRIPPLLDRQVTNSPRKLRASCEPSHGLRTIAQIAMVIALTMESVHGYDMIGINRCGT